MNILHPAFIKHIHFSWLIHANPELKHTIVIKSNGSTLWWASNMLGVGWM